MIKPPVDQSPATQFEAITPNDATEIFARAVYIGGTGNLSVVDQKDVVTVFTAVQTGQILPIAPKIIRSTGTTATGIVAIR